MRGMFKAKYIYQQPNNGLKLGPWVENTIHGICNIMAEGFRFIYLASRLS